MERPGIPAITHARRGAAVTPAPYFFSFFTPLLVVLGAHLGGAFTLLPVAFLFVALPLLDERVGVDTRNPDDAQAGAGRGWWDLPLWLWVPVQLGVTLWVTLRVAAGAPGAAETAGLTLSLGVMNGAGGITVAHELMHRAGRGARAAAELLMASVSYPHFCIEHVHGHHRRVATPDDPATSRYREGLYAFYRRCVAGSLKSAWRIESERVARTATRAFGLRDRRLRLPLLLAAGYAAVATLGGVRGLFFFVAQGAVAFSLLEVVNYLEHYGLLRREISPGSYERVRPAHSWNSSARLSNLYLFNLARHSDHHAVASRPYDRLRHHHDAPQLPAGYATMVLLALVPRLWFRVMDPRVEAWRRRAASGEDASAPA